MMNEWDTPYDDEEEYEEALSWNDYDHAKDHFQGVLECLYGKKPLKDLEWHLEEVAYVLGLPIPDAPAKEVEDV